MTPISIATKNGHWEIVQILRDHSKNPILDASLVSFDWYLFAVYGMIIG
jgi:hypothetical protein